MFLGDFKGSIYGDMWVKGIMYGDAISEDDLIEDFTII